MIRIALFVALFCVNSAFSQCAGGSCQMPSAGYYPAPSYRPSMQYFPAPAQQPRFELPTKNRAWLQVDKAEPCIHVYLENGQHIGTIWTRENSWQFAGVKEKHRMDIPVEKWQSKLNKSVQLKLPTCECGPDCPCHKR